jgi:hypothetical protein
MKQTLDSAHRSDKLCGMAQAWVAQKLVNVTFYEFLGCLIYKYLR